MKDILAEAPLWSEDEFLEWFEGLSADEKQELAGVAQKLHRVGPIEGPQRNAFNSKADILGYGGAAGGGKSALIAILTLLSHERTVIFRHDAKQLRALVDDLVDFAGTQVGLNRQSGVFVFGDRPGHMCEWGGIGRPGEEMAWRGRPHDFFAADEVTELSLRKLMFLQTWVRTKTPGQRTRTLFTFNPPGYSDELTTDEGGQWVIDFFAPWLDERHINPAEPGELRHFITLESGEEEEVEDGEPRELNLGGKKFVVRPKTRTFIPATVQDNPYLLETGYVEQLAMLEEPLRSQMLLGDFRKGIMDSPWQVIPSAWVDEAMDRWEPDGSRQPMDSLGVDVARGGRAWTSLSRRHGFWWAKTIRAPGTETPSGREVVKMIMDCITDGAMINIDVTGVGSSPYDLLRNNGSNVNGVVFAQRQNLPAVGGPMPLYNMRTALWWLARQILNPENEFKPAIPPEKKLRAELIAPRWRNANGSVLVETKDEIIKRVGRTPDDSEAFVLSLYDIFKVTPEANRILAHIVPVRREGGNRIRPSVGRNSWMTM